MQSGNSHLQQVVTHTSSPHLCNCHSNPVTWAWPSRLTKMRHRGSNRSGQRSPSKRWELGCESDSVSMACALRGEQQGRPMSPGPSPSPQISPHLVRLLRPWALGPSGLRKQRPECTWRSVLQTGLETFF